MTNKTNTSTSSTTTTQNKKELERLNNDEYRELMSNFQLEELFLTEIKKDGKWSKMFNIVHKHKKIKIITCNVCQEDFTCDGTKNHLRTLQHHDALLKIEQFYQPVYTYAKVSEKAAKGEDLTPAELQDAIEKAGKALTETTLTKFFFGKYIADRIECVEKAIYQDMLNFALTRNIDKVIHMFVRVNLPLDDIKKLEFSDSKGHWKQMLTTDTRIHQNSIYYCHLCSKVCDGITGVNQHINNFAHKKMQLECAGVRVVTHREVTRNCTFHFGAVFSLKIKNEGMLILKNIFEANKKSSTSANKDGDGNENDNDANDENNQNPNNDDNENNKINDSKQAAKQKIVYVSVPAKLSANVFAKAKLLKSKIPKIPSSVKSYTDIENHGLIGVEYVVKLTKFANDPKPVYECVLCEHSSNELEMQNHLIGYKHRLKYLELHYAKFLKEANENIDEWEYDAEKILTPIFAKVALAIENQHSRSLPYLVSAQQFARKRTEMIAKLFSHEHANEKTGPTFLNVVSKEFILELTEMKESFKSPKFDNTTPAVFTTVPKGGKTYLGKKEHSQRLVLDTPIVKTTPSNHTNQSKTNKPTQPIQTNQSKSSKPNLPSQANKPLQSNKPSQSNNKSLSSNNKPPSQSNNRSLQSNKPPLQTTRPQAQPQKVNQTSDNQRKRSNASNSNSNDIWSEYRQEIAKATSKLDYIYKGYELNPESHPIFQQEWHIFSNKRKQELREQGIDFRSYNCQNEWLDCFRGRLEQLYGEELYGLKINIRKGLNIPLDAVEGRPLRISANTAPYNANQPKVERNNEPTFKKQKYDNERPSMQTNMSTNISNTNYNTNWPSNSTPDYKNNNNNNNNNMMKYNQLPSVAYDDKKPNVIHVLRLMTALEDFLGSFGSKVTNLLSMALSIERTCYDNPKLLEENILTDANCSLLETAMEKLKGVLYAGLVDDHKVQGFNKVIQNTSDLLKYAQGLQLQKNNELAFAKQNQQSKQINKSFDRELPLSDTIIQKLMSMQKKVPSDISSRPYGYSNTMPLFNQQQSGNNFDLERSSSSSYAGVNINNQLNRSNNFVNENTGRFGLNSSNTSMRQIGGILNMNTSTNRNNTSFEVSNNFNNNQGRGFNGNGRDSFNNQNLNNKNNFNAMGNLNISSNGRSNFGNGTAVNNQKSVNDYESPMGNSNGNGYAGNWGSFRSNQQWSSNQQQAQQQYQNNRGGGNY